METNKKHITSENAREMQVLSAKKRKENTEQRRIVRSKVLEKLLKPVREGSDQTKLEWLVDKMLDNLKDNVSVKDMKDLQDIVDEKITTSNVNLTATKDSEQILKDVFGDEG